MALSPERLKEFLWGDLEILCEENGYEQPDIVNGKLYAFQGGKKVLVEHPEVVMAFENAQEKCPGEFNETPQSKRKPSLEELSKELIEARDNLVSKQRPSLFILGVSVILLIGLAIRLYRDPFESGAFAAMTQTLQPLVYQAFYDGQSAGPSIALMVATTVVKVWIWLLSAVIMFSFAFGYWACDLLWLDDGTRTRAFFARTALPVFLIYTMVVYFALYVVSL